MESENEWQLLAARRDYYDEWLRRYKEATDILPHIQNQRDMTNWELDALSNQPNEASEIPRPELNTLLQRENRYIETSLPMMPKYDVNQVINASALTTSGTASVFEFVTRVGDIGTPTSGLRHSIMYTRFLV